MRKTLLWIVPLLCQGAALRALEAPCDPKRADCTGTPAFPQGGGSPRYSPAQPTYTPSDPRFVPSDPGRQMPLSTPGSSFPGAPSLGGGSSSPLPAPGGSQSPLPEVEISPSRIKTVRETYPTGELSAERRTFDGQLDGVSKEYYKNGQVMNEWNYRLGVLEGESRSYYRNGDIKTVSPYRKGQLHGELRRYHERKILKSVETYKEGQLMDTKTYNEEGLPLDQR